MSPERVAQTTYFNSGSTHAPGPAMSETKIPGDNMKPAVTQIGELIPASYLTTKGYFFKLHFSQLTKKLKLKLPNLNVSPGRHFFTLYIFLLLNK